MSKAKNPFTALSIIASAPFDFSRKPNSNGHIQAV